MFNFIKSIFYVPNMSGPRVEYEPLNGRVINNFIIPDDIIMRILEYVNGETILSCRLVCKNWDDFVMETIRHLYHTRFHKPPEKLPLRYLFIRLYKNVFGRNLLKNVNGESQFKHWKILSNFGDKFAIERVPHGAPPLPEGVPEFNGNTSCFATSYGDCVKMQTINVPENSDLDFLLRHKVKVHASEWVCARFDCGAKYRMHLSLKSRDGNVQEVVGVHREEQWANSPWKKIEVELDDYLENIEKIEFAHFGKDTQFWAGHYGMKMAGAVVQLLPID